MSLIRQLLTGFRSDTEAEPGVIVKDDGTTWLVNPDGSETQLPGGGGSQPAYAWIGASQLADITNPHTGPVTITWSPPASEGDPGWELNADTENWDCTEDGLYIVSLEPIWNTTFPGDVTPSVSSLQLFTSWHATIADPNAPWNQTYGGDQFFRDCAVNPSSSPIASAAATIPWTLPPFQFQAGDSFNFAASTNDAATTAASGTPTATMSSSNIVITRVGT